MTPTSKERATALTALAALLIWSDRRPAAQQALTHDIALLLQRVRNSAPVAWRFIAYCSLPEHESDEDPYAGASLQYELTLTTTRFSFQRTIQHTTIAYGYVSDFMLARTGDRQFPATPEALADWLTGFQELLNDPQTYCWTDEPRTE